MSIGIGDVVKIDKQSRLHLPKTVMRAVGLEEGNSVIISYDVLNGGSVITIYPAEPYLSQEVLQKIEEK